MEISFTHSRCEEDLDALDWRPDCLRPLSSTTLLPRLFEEPTRPPAGLLLLDARNPGGDAGLAAVTVENLRTYSLGVETTSRVFFGRELILGGVPVQTRRCLAVGLLLAVRFVLSASSSLFAATAPVISASGSNALLLTLLALEFLRFNFLRRDIDTIEELGAATSTFSGVNNSNCGDDFTGVVL